MATINVHVTVKVWSDRPALAPITVTVPDLPTVPEKYRGESYSVRTLLTDQGDNLKLSKSSKSRYRIWGLSLAPSDLSGYNTCASASPGCRKACLNLAGNGQYPSVQAGRIAKTVAYMTQREAFFAKLRGELKRLIKLCKRLKKTPVVRLNVMSDIQWEKVAPWIFTEFPTVRFYDYTKHAARMTAKLPANYHLTFSRSECNEAEALNVLKAGGNVTVVFKGGLPETWNGYTVIDGDKNDLRITDPRNIVIGLKAKGPGGTDESGFVVRLTALSLPTVN
jgi:hypothetical protein